MNATIVENRAGSRGNQWLKLQLPEGAVMDFEPGTVLGLAFKKDGAAYRHPYTVSRADNEKRTLEFLFRVIPDGRMTPVFKALAPGTEINIAGRGGHPISAEVATDPEGIVLVSTGAGIGPIWGYSAMALKAGLKLPLTLVAGFREEADASLAEELEALAAAHSNFKWHFSLSRPGPHWKGLRGRVTETLHSVLGPVGNLHFHLVGNGAMVVELYEILMAAGLKDERVTSEIYFNWEDGVDRAWVKAQAEKFKL